MNVSWCAGCSWSDHSAFRSGDFFLPAAPFPRLHVRSRQSPMLYAIISEDVTDSGPLRAKARAKHIARLEELLKRGECDAKPEEFKRYGSARKLYNFDVDNAGAY